MPSTLDFSVESRDFGTGFAPPDSFSFELSERHGCYDFTKVQCTSQTIEKGKACKEKSLAAQAIGCPQPKEQTPNG